MHTPETFYMKSAVGDPPLLFNSYINQLKVFLNFITPPPLNCIKYKRILGGYRLNKTFCYFSRNSIFPLQPDFISFNSSILNLSLKRLLPLKFVVFYSYLGKLLSSQSILCRNWELRGITIAAASPSS